MSLMTRFEHGAVRKGFILEEVSVRTSDLSKIFGEKSLLELTVVWCDYQINVYILH